MRRTCALFAFFFFAVSSIGTALAQATTFLSGIVTAHDQPASGANVTVLGNNLTLHAKTDAHGRFTVTGIPIGTYTVDVTGTDGSAALQVEVPSAGATITASLTQVKQIGRSSVTSRPPIQGSGTDFTLGATTLSHSPGAGRLPDLLLQIPGAARGANGVVHVNGDHGVLGYIVDGAPVPQELNRVIGGEFDSNDIAFMEVIQGAFPAQYGERFASILNINTKSGSGPPGFAGSIDYGSFAHVDQKLDWHGNLGKGYLQIGVRDERSNRGEDPPNPSSPHNGFSNANQFLRYTLPVGNDFLNLTVSNSYQTYQIPVDVEGGAPASTNDNETQQDLFSTLQWRHPIGDHGSLSVGTFYKRSRIRDFGDPSNDFIYGEAQNSGGPNDCANAAFPAGSPFTNPVGDPNVNYSIRTCGFSLGSDRTAIDVGGNLDYENRSAHHRVAFGGLYDATHVAKNYGVTLQPGNFLAQTFPTLANPDGSFTVVDNAPNIGHLSAAYLQDNWKMSDHWELDYGVRQDLFQIFSTEFQRSFAQTSPRVKLTYTFSPYANIYAYYGRLFEPFSLENVAPAASYLLNLPLQSSPAAFDLKPQRTSDYEVGGHFSVGRGDLGVRIMQQNITDLIDDTQVGFTNLHQDINYQQGRIATQSLYYQHPLSNASRIYGSFTHTYSVNNGCETQLLAPCFGAPSDWTPADHDQRIDVNAGIVVNDRRGGWFAADGEYGSGLSSALNPNGGITCAGPNYSLNIGGPCKRTPHVVFDVEKGFGLGHGAAITVNIQNIFNDRYLVTFLNAQGNHWAPPRTVNVGYRFGR